MTNNNVNKGKMKITIKLILAVILSILVFPVISKAAEQIYSPATSKIPFNNMETVSTTDGSYYHKIDISNYGKNMSTYIFSSGSNGYYYYNDFYHIMPSRVAYQKKIAVTPGTVINVMGATTDNGEGGSDTTNSAKIYWNVMEWDANGVFIWDASWMDSSQEYVCGVSKGADGTTYGLQVKDRSEVRYVTLIFRVATGDHSIGAPGPDISPEDLKNAYSNLYLCYKPFVYTINDQGNKTTVERYGISSIDPPFNVPSKLGHTFTGWQVTSSNTVGGDNWMNGEVIDSDTLNDYVRNGKFYTSLFGNVTFTSSFSPNKYKVVFEPSGGTVSTESKLVTYNGKYGELPTPTRVGYTFSGWYTSESGGSKVTADKTMNLTDTHYIYARWSPIMYTITFDKQGGTGGSDSVEAHYTKQAPYANKPSKTGYTFKGYYTEKNGKGTQVYNNLMVPCIEYNYNSDITLYAHWADEEPPTLVLKGLNEWTNQADILTAEASDLVSTLTNITIYRVNDDGTETAVASINISGNKSGKLDYSNTILGITRYKAVATDSQGNKATAYVTSYYDNIGPVGDVIDVTLDGTKINIELDVTDVNN